MDEHDARDLEKELRDLDEGILEDIALAMEGPRRPRYVRNGDHPVLHLLLHPEARPQEQNAPVLRAEEKVKR